MAHSGHIWGVSIYAFSAHSPRWKRSVVWAQVSPVGTQVTSGSLLPLLWVCNHWDCVWATRHASLPPAVKAAYEVQLPPKSQGWDDRSCREKKPGELERECGDTANLSPPLWASLHAAQKEINDNYHVTCKYPPNTNKTNTTQDRPLQKRHFVPSS